MKKAEERITPHVLQSEDTPALLLVQTYRTKIDIWENTKCDHSVTQETGDKSAKK